MSYEYSELKVSRIEVISDNKETETYTYSLFKDLINLPLSYSGIASLLKVLQRKDNVESATVDVLEIPNGGANLTVVVRLKFKVVEISFEGNDFFSSSRLRSKLNLSEDSLVGERDVEAALWSLKELYEEAGFLQAAINYERIYSEAKDSGILRFKINEGKPCIISEVRLEGKMEGKVPAEILKRLAIKEGSVLNEKIIQKKIDKLNKKLVKENYLLAKFENPIINYNRESNNALLIINLNLGPQIKILFKGNNYYFERDSKLKEIIRLNEERQFSPTWVEAAKYELERFYKGLGYALVEISCEDNLNEEKNLRAIKFKIARNNKVLIKNISFKGNKEFAGDFLKEKLLNLDVPSLKKGLYVKEDFRKALKDLIIFYQSEGYLKAEVFGDPLEEFDKRGRRVSIVVSLSEGGKFFADEMEILGNTFASKEKVKEFLKIKKKDPYNPYLVSEGIEKLKGYYLENGFKFVRIYSQEDVGDEKVGLTILISEGDRVKIGSISIGGNKNTEEGVIRREFSISEGDYYNPAKISQSEGDVSRLGLFSSVELKETDYDFRSQKLDLLLLVQEKKRRSLKTRVGYGSDEGLRGSAELTFINIGGKGRSLSLGAQLSHRLKSENILRRKESISFREPRLFGSKLAGKIGFLDEREEEPQFNIDRSSLTIGVDSSISKIVRSSLTWNLEYRKPFDLKIDPSELSPFDEARKRLGYVDVSLDWDKRNNIFNPTEGFLSRFSFDTYNKSLLSEHNFLQFYSSNNFYIPIYRKIRSVLAIKFGFSTTYGSTRDQSIPVPIEKRFRLGGSYTLRGFALNSVGGLDSDEPAVSGESSSDQAPGGNSVFNYNLEFVFPFPFNFEFVLFTDGGEAYKSNWEFNPFNPSKIRNTAGFGIRYNTPVGPLRLDVGFILDRRTGEEWGAVQFAVGLF